MLPKGTFPSIPVLGSSWKPKLTKILMKITETEMTGAKLWPGTIMNRPLSYWGIGYV